MERAQDTTKSALDTITEKYGFPAKAIVTMNDVIEYLYKEDGSGLITNEIKKEMDEYYKEWGC